MQKVLLLFIASSALSSIATFERKPKQYLYTTQYLNPNYHANSNPYALNSNSVSIFPYSNAYPFHSLWNNLAHQRNRGISTNSNSILNQISTLPLQSPVTHVQSYQNSPYLQPKSHQNNHVQTFPNQQQHQFTPYQGAYQIPRTFVSQNYQNLWNFDMNSLRPVSQNTVPYQLASNNANPGVHTVAADRNYDANVNWNLPLKSYEDIQNDATGAKEHQKSFQRGQVESFPQKSTAMQVFMQSVMGQPQPFSRGHIEAKPGFSNAIVDMRNAGPNYKIGFIRYAVEHSNKDPEIANSMGENRVAKYEAMSPKVVCYLASWSYHRKGKGSFVPENADPSLCTHIIYAFANLDKSKFAIKESDPQIDNDKKFYQRITGLKDRNPNLKVLLAIGGWSDSGDDKYSLLANSAENRKKFARETVKFLKDRNFDGLSFDWHYPKCWQSQCELGPDSDKQAFSEIIKELKTVFQPEGLLVSATLSGYQEVVDLAYDVPTLSQYLDMINVMAYDYHGSWENRTGHLAPLFRGPAAFDYYPRYNANYTLEYYVSKGADRSKLILGVPLYGQSFTLSHIGDTSYGSEAQGPGIPGEFTQQPGMLAYYEICQRIKDKQWTRKTEMTGSWGPYAFKNDQWVGYDDSEFLKRKARFVKSQAFGGVMIWTMDLDDFQNTCCQGSQPLLRTISSELLGTSYDSNAIDCAPPVVPEPSVTIPQGPTQRPPGGAVQPITPSLSTESPDMQVTVPTDTCDNTWLYKPDPMDCSVYYQCSGGIATMQKCPMGLHWNQYTHSCDWPNNAKCAASSTTETPSTEAATEETTRTTTTRRTTTTTKMTTTSRPQHVTTSQRPPASQGCKTGEYTPGPRCDQYYLCNAGMQNLQSCGPGLHWNRDKYTCDWPQNANCQSSSGNDGTPEPIRQQPPCREGDYEGDSRDCEIYYVCNHGKRIQFRCQGGLHWNNNAKVCDWPQLAGCTATGGGGEEEEEVPSLTTEDTPIITHRPTNRPTSTFRPTRPTTTTSNPGTTEWAPTNKPIQGSKNDFMIVCYFTNWAWYRPGMGKYKPENIDPDLCTHIVYGFAVLDYTDLVIKPHDTWADYDNHFYDQVTAFKSRGTKVTLAIGGWNDSAGDKYSRLVNDPAARRKFIKSVVEFIKKHNFDGLDLDWEYPVCWQVECEKGPSSDKENFAAFVRELHEAFKPHGLLLSSAVSPSKLVIDKGYDVPTISKYLDWIAVMTYDYHGQWDKKTGHVAPFYFHEDDDYAYFNANYTINYWISQGADRKKIIMGMPLYGQSFTLADPNDNGLNDPTIGGGTAGEFTRASGFLAYYEICAHIQKDGWKVVRDRTGAIGPYAYKGNQWVSFDDAGMIRRKSQYIKDMGLGGGMVWALDLDDFRNSCGEGNYPLLTTIKNVLGKRETSEEVKKPTTTEMAVVPTNKPTMTTTRRTTTTTRRTTTTTKMPTTKRPRPAPITEDTEAIIIGEPDNYPAGIRVTPPSNMMENHPAIMPVENGPREDPCRSEPFRPHESDCTKYYQCVFGKYMVQQCAPGTYWNKDRCDWTCGSEPTESGSGGSIPSTTTTRRPTKPPPSTTTTTPRPWTNPSSTTSQKPWTDWTPSPTPSTISTSTSWEWKPPIITTTTILPVDVQDTEYKVVCYFTNWAWYRQGIGKYKPEDIDYNLCTHIAYGFAVLNPSTLEIRTHDSWADIDNQFYTQVSSLKSKGKKVVIAIGGWNDSLGDKYSRLVRDAAARRKFIQNVLVFIKKYDFDGLDLDWEYPKCWQTDCKLGPEMDKANFATFVRELKEAFIPHGYLLSSAVTPSKTIIDEGYDVPTVSKYLDWIAVMTYDYHGQWDKKTGHVAPMYNHEESDNFYFNTNYTINYWISQGADKKKIIMGMPMYGQSFTLSQPANHGLNSPASGGGEAGEFTRAQGFLAYYEICKNIKDKKWTVVQDETGALGPYAYKGNQWVSFDDAAMIRRKSQYIKDMGLGGGMIWALDLDDFRNVCGCEKHPLLKTINRVLRNYPEPDPQCKL